MTGRYLLVVCGSRPHGSAGRPPNTSGLQSAISTPRFQLLVNSDQPWLEWPGRSAGVVGDLYSKESAAPHPSPDLRPDGDFDELDLISSFWGNYVSFRADGPNLQVMRDPSGTLPCFYALENGSIYLASDVAILVQALGLVPAIDWDQLARLLHSNDLPEERTALAGVHELLPGHMLVSGEDRITIVPLWSPWHYVEHDVEPTPAQLEQCVRQCVTIIGAPFQSVLIGVSGGLDSSILASCLSGRAQSVHPVTISTDDAHGDEATFAQILCSHLGLPLIREAYRLDAVDITRSSVAHLPRPGGRAQLQAYDAAVKGAAARIGASAFLSGVGGDNVFYYTNSARALVDHYLERGLGSHLIPTLRDICRLTGCTIGQAIREALAVPRGGETHKYRWRSDDRFLHPDRIAQLTGAPLSHPWLEGPGTSKPGRAAHIAMILRAQRYLDGQDREGPVAFLQPLMAQPIIELCLGIPSWRAIENGRDRAVARQAFAASLPSAIIERRVKGGPDGFAHQIIRANLSEVRERLLGGVLAAQRILDLPVLELALREERLMGGIDYVRILLLLDTEAWARHWIDRAVPTLSDFAP